MKSLLAAATCCFLTSLPAHAEGDFDVAATVKDNLVAVFYHEFGHAVINLWELPVFGREEDAADALSIAMIDRFYEDDVAEEIIRSVAGAYQIAAESEDEDFPYWDVHGSNEQRFYNTVCLFYGFNPEARKTFAQEMGLPEERADGCPAEAELVQKSWGAILDELINNGAGKRFSLTVSDQGAPLTAEVMKDEVESLNGLISMDFDLPIVIKPCGEPNAFYSEETKDITMCSEFEPYMTGLVEKM